MSDLWIYYRRPSSLTRYRHGGAAAFDPVWRSPLARTLAPAAKTESLDDEKILQFPVPAPRPQRATKKRRARPKPPGPKKKPKKRD